jgi:hypothetical protein
MKQREHVTDLKVAFELLPFRFTEKPLSILLGQFVHMGQITLTKAQFKEKASSPW